MRSVSSSGVHQHNAPTGSETCSHVSGRKICVLVFTRVNGSSFRLRVSVFAAFVCVASVQPLIVNAQSNYRTGMTGEQLFAKACGACHASDGKGQPREVRGFETEPPDFTECRLTTPEADLDWESIIHLGGRARSFNRMMPSFADELTDDEIRKIIAH